jgi:phage tail-like protein
VSELASEPSIPSERASEPSIPSELASEPSMLSQPSKPSERASANGSVPGGVALPGRATGGWLLAQLPAAMRRDRVIGGFVRAFEEIGDSVRDQVNDVEYELDVNLASPEMLSYLASWLGVAIDAAMAASDDPVVRDVQRRLIRAVGQALVWRGTRRGLETLLEALTDSRVDVRDPGGVFGPGDQVPPGGDTILVEIDDPGLLNRQQILAFLAEELPVGVLVDLRIRAEGGVRR